MLVVQQIVVIKVFLAVVISLAQIIKVIFFDLSEIRIVLKVMALGHRCHSSGLMRLVSIWLMTFVHQGSLLLPMATIRCL